VPARRSQFYLELLAVARCLARRGIDALLHQPQTPAGAGAPRSLLQKKKLKKMAMPLTFWAALHTWMSSWLARNWQIFMRSCGRPGSFGCPLVPLSFLS
jgi:hypothetical protein